MADSPVPVDVRALLDGIESPEKRDIRALVNVLQQHSAGAVGRVGGEGAGGTAYVAVVAMRQTAFSP